MADTQFTGARQPRFKSLTFEVSALIVLIVTMVMAVFATGFILTQRQRTADSITSGSQLFASLSAKDIDDSYARYYNSTKSGIFQTFEKDMKAILAKDANTKRVQLLHTNGTLLFDSNELGKGRYSGPTRIVEEKAVLDQLKKTELTAGDVTVGGRTYLQIMMPVTAANGDKHMVRYLVDRAGAVSSRLMEVYKRMALLCLALLLLSVVAALLIAARISRPVKLLTVVTQKISSGDLTQRVPSSLANEYGQLAMSFNAMADKLQQVYEGLERKVSEKTAQLAQKVQEVEAEKVKDDALLSSIGEGMIAADADGKVVKINQPAVDMLELEGKDVVGKTISSMVKFMDDGGKNEVAPESQPGYMALHDGQKTEQVYQIGRQDQAKVVVSIISSPVRLQEQNIGVIMVVRDVTKEREVDRMKTEFISLASHQLRTPLSAIRWFCEMLISGDAGKLTTEQSEFAKNIFDSTDRMIQLVSSLLNISRIESGRIIIDPKPTDLKQLVSGIVNDLHAKIEERNQNLVISVHQDLPKINIDPRLIGQVYLNLLTNAIKYTPKGGDITVMVSKKDDQIVSQVADNGYGIPKNQQDRMFQKFFRADNVAKVETDGTGLGMYLVKAIIESSGGKIWFESEEGKGTTFWFSLPATGMVAKEGEVTLDS